MNKPIRFCFLILFCTFFVGCVSFQNDPAISVKEESSRLTNEFYEKALYAERQKDLVTAKKYYQLAITADPLNKKAQNGLAQTNKHLQSLSDKHYLNSIELYRKGKYSDAKRYLLMALRFWPENVAARQALTASQNLTVKKYVWHTIKKGETLSKISKTFYDNPHQSGIIAQINNIKDAANIQVGMKIKIPELKDHPFINQVSTDIQDHWADESIEPEQKLDPVMMYKTLGIEFYKDLQFDSAVVEFKKVLSADPSDTESMDYISKAYLEMGSIAHTQKKFLTAIEHFQNALAFNENCLPCKNNISQSKEIYKELHYKSGMKLFDEQNLNMAILEWECVQKMDPEYKKVAELLDKAKTIQKNIDAIKKSE